MNQNPHFAVLSHLMFTLVNRAGVTGLKRKRRLFPVVAQLACFQNKETASLPHSNT